MKKAQLTIYLDAATLGALETYAERRNRPKSLVAEAAIASFLSPDASERQEAAVALRLDRIGRALERLERNDKVAIEMMALFVRSWLISTPVLPEQATGAARNKGGERYAQFVAALGRRLAGEMSLAREISLDGTTER